MMNMVIGSERAWFHKAFFQMIFQFLLGNRFLLKYLGIGGMQTIIARRLPELVRLVPDLPLPPLPVWITAHQALRHTPRIRRVFDHLTQAFRALKP